MKFSIHIRLMGHSVQMYIVLFLKYFKYKIAFFIIGFGNSKIKDEKDV